MTTTTKQFPHTKKSSFTAGESFWKPFFVRIQNWWRILTQLPSSYYRSRHGFKTTFKEGERQSSANCTTLPFQLYATGNWTKTMRRCMVWMDLRATAQKNARDAQQQKTVILWRHLNDVYFLILCDVFFVSKQDWSMEYRMYLSKSEAQITNYRAVHMLVGQRTTIQSKDSTIV